MNRKPESSTQEINGLLSRRSLLQTASCGFGYMALMGMCGEAAARDDTYKNPLAVRPSHFKPSAKRVIFLFMQGGPPQVDTFDYKPQLQKNHGKKTGKGSLMASPFKFKPSGKSKLPISEVFPNLSKHADDLCLLNGMHTTNPAHPQATVLAHTGSINFVRPSVGSWVLYGLGTENNDLPGFITINPPNRLGGAQNYGSAFLPACFQGTPIGSQGASSLPNLYNRELTSAQQRKQLDLVQKMNRELRERSGVNDELDGVIESFELAFRMQGKVPEVMDIKNESQKTLENYGIGRGKASDAFGKQCLMARRFAENDVRYIEVHHGGWDLHNGLKARLTKNAASTDAPIAGLLSDLKERDMLKDTLVVWGGEFGRTPAGQSAKGDGRRHNNRGYSMWMAGGGIRGGMRYGATDEFGDTAIKGKIHIHDLHATMLHQLGLHHEKLTYKYAGRDFRLTDVYGNVVKEIIA